MCKREWNNKLVYSAFIDTTHNTKHSKSTNTCHNNMPQWCCQVWCQDAAMYYWYMKPRYNTNSVSHAYIIHMQYWDATHTHTRTLSCVHAHLLTKNTHTQKPTRMYTHTHTHNSGRHTRTNTYAWKPFDIIFCSVFAQTCSRHVIAELAHLNAKGL